MKDQDLVTTAEMPRPAGATPIGSWQCPRCHLCSMETWRGSPHPDDAPSCCGGDLMLPYRISAEQQDRAIKTVSRWIDDIEATETEAGQ